MSNLKITLKKSTICAIPKHKKTVQALGLRKLNSSVIKKDNPAMRGMINQVRHLVTVEEVRGPREDPNEVRKSLRGVQGKEGLK